MTTETVDPYTAVKPPYTYVGGKRKMIEFILANTPTDFEAYFEPFLGGGAIAIEMMKRFPEKTFHLSDFNDEIVLTWQAIQADVEPIIEHLREHELRHTRPESEEARRNSYFYAVRDWDRTALLSMKSPAERAARFIYICSASFGGGYRVNKDGLCSSVIGRPILSFSPKSLRALHQLLNDRDVRISMRSFEVIRDEVRVGDFIYLDPPYATDTEDGSAGVDEYVKSNETASIQAKVKKVMNSATARGAYCLVSNSSTPSTTQLWEGWHSLDREVMWSGGVAKRVNVERLWANHNLVRAITARGSTLAS